MITKERIETSKEKTGFLEACLKARDDHMISVKNNMKKRRLLCEAPINGAWASAPSDFSSFRIERGVGPRRRTVDRHGVRKRTRSRCAKTAS